jgi:hypothetical protein
MTYNRTIGNDFWFELDNQTLWNRTQKVSDAIIKSYGAIAPFPDLDLPVDAFRTSYHLPNHPVPFVSQMQPGKSGFIELADIVLAIVDAHLDNEDAIRSAFEDFGQGVLFDNRRNPGFKVHKMDGDPLSWVGYHRWNSFMRTVQLFGHNESRWLFLNKCLGLAWAIQTVMNPSDDVVNPNMEMGTLSKLRSVWMSMTASGLDWAFANHRYRAPEVAEIQARFSLVPVLSGFARVQQILESAVPSGNPRHGGQGKFWQKKYQDFIELTVYGQKLIAAPGVNRGANSALVKILRGQLASFPRMPMPPLPPIPDTDIAWIENWIDSGLPEV